MGENSKIEWTTHTFNPWIGCQKVSPGCDNCYAETLMDKRLGRVEWGPHGERKRTSDANWSKPLQWDRAAAKAGVRHRVFCASLADWLDNKVPAQWRLDLAALIEKTPNLDWLLLTKRIENFATHSPWDHSQIPTNVWLGVTAEDQKHYTKRWKILRGIPATVRFISYEPALGEITDIHQDDKPDWIIMGGESGNHTPMMEPEWAYEMKRLCGEYSVPFFMKQMTDKARIPDDLLIRQFPVPY
jgi:protein gp37